MRHTFLRRGAAALLALTLCLGVLPARGAAAESGPSDWAREEVEQAAQLGLTRFNEYTDYQGKVTRQEFATMAVLFYNQAGNRSMEYNGVSPFSDVNDIYVTQAYRLGILQGVSDTEFAPARPISRAEICTLYDRLLGKLKLTLPQPCAAEAEALANGAEGPLESWSVQGVRTIVGAGVMKGGQAGYALGDPTSREQAALLSLRMYRMVKERQGEVFTPEELARIEELKALEEEIGVSHMTGERYLVQPQTEDVTALVPGKLEEAFLQDGLNAINYARILAGLPGDVVYTAEKNTQAQKGALLLAVGGFSHYPSQPDGMDEGLYTQGYAVTSSSNIGSGHGSLFSFNMSCMDDSDSGNIDRVGHRRWLLNPDLKVVGMGNVDGKSVTMVFDRSRSPSLRPDMVCWPAPGVFPLNKMPLRLGWSCSPDKSKYDLGASDKLSVTVTRLTDGEVFELDRSMADPTGSGPYLVVNTGGYGYGPAVIFRPGVDGYSHGDQFQVEIKNVKLTNGGLTTIEYTTKLYE